MEWGLVLLLMRTAAVLFPLLVMLWALVVAIQVLVVLAMQLLGYRRQTLPSRYQVVCVSWYSFQRSHHFLEQSAVLFPRIFSGLTALHPTP